MIHSIELNNLELSNFSYLNKLNLDKKINFKEGTNILIGGNGRGKSSILNIIKQYTLCNLTFYSTLNKICIRNNLYHFDKFYSGIDVKANYNISTYSLRKTEYIKNLNPEHILELVQFMNNSELSKGEDNLTTINMLFDQLFNPKNNIHNNIFPLNEIKDIDDFTELYEYYKSNHVIDDVYTIIMDEPDENLDVNHINDLYDILKEKKEKTQLIVSLHNPLLIYKLSKLNYINFIDLSDYLNKIYESFGKRIYTKI